MTFDEHMSDGERLLASAKDIARLKPESEADKKANEATMFNLMDFARLHFMAAQAMATAYAKRTGYV